MNDSKKQMFLMVLPVLLLISTYVVFLWCADLFGLKVGYFCGFLFYWLFWCILVPYLTIGGQELFVLFKDICPRFGKFKWLNIGLLIIPPLMAILFGPFLTRIPQTTFLVLALSFLLAVVNATLEEILWRGVYIKVFPRKIFLGYLYPVIGFAVWHVSPQVIYPSSQGAFQLVMGAGFIGLCWGWVALRTGTIRWTTISHILLDFSGMGALFYFS